MKTKQSSGGARLILAGYKPVLCGFTAEEHAELKRAAIIAGVSMTALVKEGSLEKVRKILEKEVKTP